MSPTRRQFLKNSTFALAATIALPSWFTRVSVGSGRRDKRLVVIFQRGAADGLNMVVPHREPCYHAMRPSIGIPRSAVLDLDGFFGLHPSLSPFLPLWNQRYLAIIHAAGSPHPTRRHFDAQDFMESGVPGVRSGDGWMTRASQSGLAAATGFSWLPMLSSSTRALGAQYHRGAFGACLHQLAQLLKANPEQRLGFAEIGGWDHHQNQGGVHGRLAVLLREFSQSIAAFWIDLGDLAENTVLVTMSEFGRSLGENHRGGTDHGHGNVMFVLGGPVKGGVVYGRWPGLEPSQLYEGRDLAVATDFRQVLGELIYKHVGRNALDSIFPGFDNRTGSFLNFLG